MNPKLTYDIIINKAKVRDCSKIIGEWHHIIPKCMNGTDDPNNLVKLTYKEHYFCHYLLIKIYPNNYKLYYAYNIMTNDCRHGKILSLKFYSKFKEELYYINSKLSSERLKDPEFAKPIREGFMNYLYSDRNINMQNLWKDEVWAKYKSELQSNLMIDKWKNNHDKIIYDQQKVNAYHICGTHYAMII